MRKPVLLVAGVAAALLLAAGVWWVFGGGQPSRPPELSGRVEAVRRSGRGVSSFLVRSARPDLPGWRSAGPGRAGGGEVLCWVNAPDAAKVRRRGGGGTGEVEVGQAVSAWCS